MPKLQTLSKTARPFTPAPTPANDALGMPVLVATLLAILLGSMPLYAGEVADNGTFRVLNQTLPEGSRNAEYLARLMAVNADGAVTWSMSDLPAGMTLDSQTGFITGLPTTNYNQNITLTADDGTQVANQIVNLKINASGGGGNGGSTFANGSIPAARVGLLFAEMLSLSGGVGPYIFGASDLPLGVGLDGRTGLLSGTPTRPGTYYVSLSVTDFGENNKVVTVLPLVVLPAGSQFRFGTTLLVNGEIGVDFCDQWTVAENLGPVTWSASGLPPGLSVDPDTGRVTGTPTQAGLFEIVISATDTSDTIRTNLAMVIAPSTSSAFHWEYFGLPAALVNEDYNRQPAILVAARNGTLVTYEVFGLPAGMNFDTNTGELSGTPTEVGEFPLVFTATDASNGEALTLSITFPVLPPNGGDVRSIPVNFWVVKQLLRTGTGGKDSWKGLAIYNADRRAPNGFNPVTDWLRLTLGATSIDLAPDSLTGSSKSLSFASPKGESPTVKVKLAPGKQTLGWSLKAGDLGESLPGSLRQTLTLGGRGYVMDSRFDAKGTSRPPVDLERTAFVVRSGKLQLKGGNQDAATLSMLLGDPTFAYVPGVDTLRIRLFDGGQVLLDREFGALGTAKIGTDKRTGAPSYSIKTLKDESATDRVQLRYDSRTGKTLLKLSGAKLSGLSTGEVHLGVELTIGAKTYYTAVTLFAPKAGKYSTKMP